MRGFVRSVVALINFLFATPRGLLRTQSVVAGTTNEFTGVLGVGAEGRVSPPPRQCNPHIHNVQRDAFPFRGGLLLHAQF